MTAQASESALAVALRRLMTRYTLANPSDHIGPEMAAAEAALADHQRRSQLVPDGSGSAEVLAAAGSSHKPVKAWLITDMHEGSEPTEYAFSTAIERAAFVDGVFVALNSDYALVDGPDWVLDADLNPVRKPADNIEHNGAMRP